MQLISLSIKIRRFVCFCDRILVILVLYPTHCSWAPTKLLNFTMESRGDRSPSGGEMLRKFKALICQAIAIGSHSQGRIMRIPQGCTTGFDKGINPSTQRIGGSALPIAAVGSLLHVSQSRVEIHLPHP